jgi:ATP-binding cassette subfamily F protein uup
VRISYVPQDPAFDPQLTVGEVLESAAREPALAAPVLGQAGFTDAQARTGELSGGWRKRLALARALVEQADLLLLDEPTNHLDLEGILWLEKVLANAPFASIIVTHDRYFLENVANHVAELNRVYPEGVFRVEGNYSEFLEKREQYFEAQARQRESLAVQVRREVDWLRRGPKARTRKSKARLDTAGQLIEDLAAMDARRVTSTAGIDFAATDRRTKKLLTGEGLAARLGGRTLFENLSLTLTPGIRLGIAGGNGSGKTTLLRMLLGELAPSSGTISRAEDLQEVYFDQHRDQLDLSWTLKQALAPEGDSVIYLGRVIHVNAWARRFLFDIEQLGQPLERLSGGERARVLIARLMLRPADILLLDEPTNDLDIPTLSVLEESLTDFPGALVLVTHDRYLLDRVSNRILGLDGSGGATHYADYAQWEADLGSRKTIKPAVSKPADRPAPAAQPRKKLAYIEQREWDAMEERILEAESRLKEAKDLLHSPEVVSDPKRLDQVYREMTAAQTEVDTLYTRWAELEAKLG